MASIPMKRKALNVPYDALLERGFRRVSDDETLRVQPGKDPEAIVCHPLNFLDDMRLNRTRFTEFEDEMVPFERDGEVFDLFATTIVDRFLFVGRTDGRVYQHIGWSPDDEGPTFEPINSSLLAFVRCHCMEQSICFRMRAAMAGSVDYEVFNGATGEREAELRRFIKLVDEPALDSVYWSTVLYELEEGFYRCVPTLLELLHKSQKIAE